MEVSQTTKAGRLQAAEDLAVAPYACDSSISWPTSGAGSAARPP
jgi:hypothetical protein